MPDWQIRPLSLSQVREIYRTRMVEDFPDDERKPLGRIERALAEGRYACYGCFSGERLDAYAFFVLGRADICMLDYFAVEKTRRGLHIGSRFLRELTVSFAAEKSLVLAEVDAPSYAADAQEQDRRTRRLRFYLQGGLRDTGVTARVYHAEYLLLSFPGSAAPDPAGIAEAYRGLYRDILPPSAFRTMVEVPIPPQP